jgi:DNA-binding response OmpR family regulator
VNQKGKGERSKPGALDSAVYPPRVLLAEDDSALRPLIADRFRAAGFDVVEADDGNAVVECIADSIVTSDRLPGFDLIVSDIRLPGLNAFDVLRAARSALEATPVILMTAFGDQRTRERALSLGASAVIDKPLDLDQLVSTARRFLRRPPAR